MLQSTNSLFAGVCMVVALASCTDSGPPCLQDADCFDNNVCHESTCIDPKDIPSSGSGGSSGASTSGASSSSTAAASGSGSDAGGSSNGCVTPPDFTEYHIDRSVTICPQTYYGTTLVLDASDITVGGNGVTLNLGKSESAISIHNVDNTHVYGFTVLNCGDDGAVSIVNSSQNWLNFLTINTLGFGLSMDNASNNLIEDVEITTELSGAIIASETPNLTIFRTNVTSGTAQQTNWPAMMGIGNSQGVRLSHVKIALLSQGTPLQWEKVGDGKITDCTISSPAYGISLGGVASGLIAHNTITTGTTSGTSCIDSNATNSTIHSNTLVNCPTACRVGCDQNGNVYNWNTHQP